MVRARSLAWELIQSLAVSVTKKKKKKKKEFWPRLAGGLHEPWRLHAQGNKPDAKGKILYDFTHKSSLCGLAG